MSFETVYLFNDSSFTLTERSTAAEIRSLRWKLFKQWVQIKWLNFLIVLKHKSPVHIAREAHRYRKLRDLMTRNRPDTWEEVSRIASVGCYVDWDAFDAYLDQVNVKEA